MESDCPILQQDLLCGTILETEKHLIAPHVVKMWNKANTPTLLMRLSISTATLESNLVNTVSWRHAYPGIQQLTSRTANACVYTGACQWTEEREDWLWYIHIIKYCRMNPSISKWRNFENIICGEKRKLQCNMVWFM